MAPGFHCTRERIIDDLLRHLIQSSPALHYLTIMAPAALEVQEQIQEPVSTKTVHREPLQLSNALDSYESFDVTPVIGREFPSANLVDWLNAPNADELIRDLAITSK